MQPSSKCIGLIQEFEGCELRAYQDQGGKWTIGYGHTFGVYPGLVITQAQADAFLQSDSQNVAIQIASYVKVPLTQGQFDALTSITFNEGIGRISGSTLMEKLNMGDYQGASGEFARWNLVQGVVDPGLVRRRAAERALFLSADDGSAA
ncbi:lysozyme [Dyella mobilis]|uniref:Lysozyme n=1 Tax=Dyella mobilis TaxID=1849582 RepID=A0ABS2KME3_9GAMM|nr:lysozyme [Dyella mobilis]MBM7131573.1 lysozyme [Dyella mobilis]GLQ96455.1 lysozyme [Dyella mobilis]